MPEGTIYTLKVYDNVKTFHFGLELVEPEEVHLHVLDIDSLRMDDGVTTVVAYQRPPGQRRVERLEFTFAMGQSMHVIPSWHEVHDD